MRDVFHLTYNEISEILKGEGVLSPRGNILEGNYVFSIYKKRKIRDIRYNSENKISLQNIEIEIVEK
jgi:hypothetical protein